MLTQNELKYYSALLQKKYRMQEHKFIIEGKKLVDEAIKSKYKCEIVITNESFADKNNLVITNLNEIIRTEIIPENNFKKLVDTKTTQGIVAVVSIPSTPNQVEESENLIVALEDISDPGNVGTIIRTCNWFGVHRVIVSPNSVDLFNPKVIRSTMGSIFHMDVYESNDFYADLVNLKKEGRKVFCSDMNGKNIFSDRVKEKTVLILSNEAHGPTEAVLELSDEIVTIPKRGDAESLNVASAAAVMIAELTK